MKILVFLPIILLAGCIEATKSVWTRQGYKSESIYTANHIGVVFEKNNQICILPSTKNENGVIIDGTNFLTKNIYIRYKLDIDVRNINEPVKEITISDSVIIDTPANLMYFQDCNASIRIGDVTYNAICIGGGVANSDIKVQLLKSDIIHYKRTMKRIERDDPPIIGKVLVTPIAVLSDAVVTSGALVSSPIWFPFLCIMWKDI